MSDPDSMVHAVYTALESQHAAFPSITETQRIVLSPSADPKEKQLAVAQLHDHHSRWDGALNEESRAVRALMDQTYLSPANVSKCVYLEREIRMQRTRLRVLGVELQSVVSTGIAPTPVCVMAFGESPLPTAVLKGKCLADPIHVHLITSAGCSVQDASRVQLMMLPSGGGAGGGTGSSSSRKSKDYSIGECALDSESLSARFFPTFNKGSRSSLVSIKCGTSLCISDVNGVVHNVTAESDKSLPLVVMTNECQWEKAEGLILRHESFAMENVDWESASRVECPWPRFANLLQRRFVWASKQNVNEPARCLSRYDLEYIRSRWFGGGDVVTKSSAELFWAWFGPMMQKIRYTRNIGAMYMEGCICGFISKEDVNKALGGAPEGTYIVRFSESHAGQFAVAYATAELDASRVHHYLVKQDDTPRTKGLPDFLGEFPGFRYLLQVIFDGAGNPSLRPIEKDVALEKFYSKKRGAVDKELGDYDSNLVL